MFSIQGEICMWTKSTGIHCTAILPTSSGKKKHFLGENHKTRSKPLHHGKAGSFLVYWKTFPLCTMPYRKFEQEYDLKGYQSCVEKINRQYIFFQFNLVLKLPFFKLDMKPKLSTQHPSSF